MGERKEGISSQENIIDEIRDAENERDEQRIGQEEKTIK